MARQENVPLTRTQRIAERTLTNDVGITQIKPAGRPFVRFPRRIFKGEPSHPFEDPVYATTAGGKARFNPPAGVWELYMQQPFPFRQPPSEHAQTIGRLLRVATAGLTCVGVIGLEILQDARLQFLPTQPQIPATHWVRPATSDIPPAPLQPGNSDTPPRVIFTYHPAKQR